MFEFSGNLLKINNELVKIFVKSAVFIDILYFFKIFFEDVLF